MKNKYLSIFIVIKKLYLCNYESYVCFFCALCKGVLYAVEL